MRITLRLIVALVLTVATVAAISAYFQVRQERFRLKEEMERRSRLLAESLQESVQPVLQQDSSTRLQRLVEKFSNRERVLGIAIYDATGNALAVTQKLAPGSSTVSNLVANALDRGVEVSDFSAVDGVRLHVFVMPLLAKDVAVGALVIFQDASYIQSQLARIWRTAFLRVLVQVFCISLVTLLVVRWSIVGPIAKMAVWMKQLRAGEASTPAFALPKEDLFGRIAREGPSFTGRADDAFEAGLQESGLCGHIKRLASWTPQSSL